MSTDTFYPYIRNLQVPKNSDGVSVKVGDSDNELGGNWGGKALAIDVVSTSNLDIVDVCLSDKSVSSGRCTKSVACINSECPFNVIYDVRTLKF